MAAEDTVKINILADVKDAVLGFGKAALALAGITMSVKAVIQFVSQSVQEYLKAEEALAKMNAALRGTGGYSAGTSAALEDLTEQLMRTTKYGHEASQEALALMMSLGGMTAKMAGEALPAIQDLAAGLGIDLTSAAMMYSKAAEGNTAALGRYGIKVDETLKGDDALAAVTDKIREKFGGMAQAMGDTASGSLTKLNNAFGEVKEELGRFVVGEAKGFIDWLTDVAFKLSDVMAAANNLREALRAQAAGFADTSDKMTIANARYTELNKLIAEADIISKNYNLTQQMLNYLKTKGYDSIEQYRKALVNERASVRLSIQSLDKLAEAEDRVANAKAAAAAATSKYEDEISLAYAKTAEGQRVTLEKEIAKYEGYVEKLGNRATREREILDELRKKWEETYGAKITPPIAPGVPEEQLGLQPGIDYAALREGIGIDKAAKAERERMSDLYADEQERIGHINSLKEYGLRLAEESARAARNITEEEEKAAEAAELWEKSMVDLKADFQGILMQAAEGGLYELFYQMGQAAAGAGDAAESFRDWFGSLMSKIGQLFIAAGLSAIIQGHYYVGIGLLLLGGVMAIAAGAAAATETSTPVQEQAGLVHLAGGGIVRRPTMALIGESGPEAVIPLGRGGAGGVTVNVYGSVWSGDDLAREIAGKLR